MSSASPELVKQYMELSELKRKYKNVRAEKLAGKTGNINSAREQINAINKGRAASHGYEKSNASNNARDAIMAFYQENPGYMPQERKIRKNITQKMKNQGLNGNALNNAAAKAVNSYFSSSNSSNSNGGSPRKSRKSKKSRKSRKNRK